MSLPTHAPGTSEGLPGAWGSGGSGSPGQGCQAASVMRWHRVPLAALLTFGAGSFSVLKGPVLLGVRVLGVIPSLQQQPQPREGTQHHLQGGSVSLGTTGLGTLGCKELRLTAGLEAEVWRGRLLISLKPAIWWLDLDSK